MAVFMLETLKLSKTLKPSRDDFNVKYKNGNYRYLFSSRSKLQNVNIILLGAFPDATDAFSDTSIVYYSSKRYMCHQHF